MAEDIIYQFLYDPVHRNGRGLIDGCIFHSDGLIHYLQGTGLHDIVTEVFQSRLKSELHQYFGHHIMSYTAHFLDRAVEHVEDGSKCVAIVRRLNEVTLHTGP